MISNGYERSLDLLMNHNRAFKILAYPPMDIFGIRILEAKIGAQNSAKFNMQNENDPICNRSKVRAS